MFTYDVDEAVQLALQAPHQAAEQYRMVEASRAFLAPWMPWMSWVRSEEAIARALAKPLAGMAEGNTFGWAIRYRGEPAGRIMLSREEGNRGELGYWLGEAFTGHGIMTRAARAIVDWGFGVLRLHRIDIHIEADNTASRAVAERLGARLDAVFREETWRIGGRADLCAYGLLASEWQVNSRPIFARRIGGGLSLRLQQLSDATAMFRVLVRNAASFSEVLDDHRTPEHSIKYERAYTKQMLEHYAEGKAIFMGIWHDEELIGSITLHINRQNQHGRIDYVLHPRAPRAVAESAVRAVLQHAFETLQVNRCWMRFPLHAEQHHEVSVAVGMRHEATLREWASRHGTRIDMMVMSILREEWEPTR